MQFVKYPFLTLCSDSLRPPPCYVALTMGSHSTSKNYLMLPLLFSYQKSTYSVLARRVFPELNTVAKQHLTQFRS